MQAAVDDAECPIYLNLDLRERHFGEFELQDSTNYDKVWEEDLKSADHHVYAVESVSEVVLRTSRAIEQAERHYKEADILFVSHGDCLQIMQTIFLDVPGESHRSLPHLETCELRRLN